MIRVRFLRGTALGGIGNDAYPGDERDLSDTQAAHYIASGRAVRADAVAPAPTLEAPKPRKRK
jgi:hypothetical protein